MLLSLLAVACVDHLVTEDGEEPVRGALYVPIVDPSTTIGFDGGDAAAIVVANSPLPCEPETDEDDPTTPNQDEALEAERYWEYTLQAAFTREGAWVVGFVLFRDADADAVGDYRMDADAWTDPDTLVGHYPRVAAGFWLHVEEAGAADGEDEAIVTDEVLAEDHASDIADPATLTVDAYGDGEAAGHFDLQPDDVAGAFHAEVCENADLVGLFVNEALDNGYL